MEEYREELPIGIP